MKHDLIDCIGARATSPVSGDDAVRTETFIPSIAILACQADTADTARRRVPRHRLARFVRWPIPHEASRERLNVYRGVVPWAVSVPSNEQNKAWSRWAVPLESTR